jgi:hypothetical protein
MDLPISQLVLWTAEAARGPIVKLPTMGGSVPLFMIEELLHAPTITVPMRITITISTGSTRTSGCRISGTGLS